MVRRATPTKKKSTNPDESLNLSKFSVIFIIVFVLIILFSFSEATALLRMIDYRAEDLINEMAVLIRQLMEAFTVQ